MPKLEDLNAATTVAQIRGTISPSLHPDQLMPEAAALVQEGADDVGTAAYTAGRKAQKALYDSLSSVDEVHEQHLAAVEVGRDRLGKPILQRQVAPESVDALRTAFSQSYQRAAIASATAIETIDKSIAALESQVATALRHPRASSTDVATAAAQIRQFIRDVPISEKMNTLHKLIVIQKNAEVAQAILSSTGWVSGLEPTELARVREMAAESLAPVATSKLAAVKSIRQKVEQSLNVYAENFAKKMPSPRPESPRQKAMAKLRVA